MKSCAIIFLVDISSFLKGKQNGRYAAENLHNRARRGQVYHAHHAPREGIGSSEFDLIQAVRCHPGITQAEVCQRLEIDKGAAARQFARLEAKGYLRRETNSPTGAAACSMPPIRQRNSRIPRRIWKSCSMNGCWSP